MKFPAGTVLVTLDILETEQMVSVLTMMSVHSSQLFVTMTQLAPTTQEATRALVTMGSRVTALFARTSTSALQLTQLTFTTVTTTRPAPTRMARSTAPVTKDTMAMASRVPMSMSATPQSYSTTMIAMSTLLAPITSAATSVTAMSAGEATE